ncbi:hypothetical protein OG216_09645 [Streptomycetaceae bacterium NBC_01309]
MVLLPPLATADDLADYTQSAIPLATAERALRTASATIRSFTRQIFTRVDNDEVILAGGERVLVLPQRPAVVDDDHPLTVVELADGGGADFTALEGRDYTRLGSELSRGFPWPAQDRYMGWPYDRVRGIWAPRVRVIYSHGDLEAPDDVVGICLDLAAATVSNPNRLRSESSGSVSVTYTVETFGTGKLTDDHRLILSRYRRTMHSVAPR